MFGPSHAIRLCLSELAEDIFFMRRNPSEFRRERYLTHVRLLSSYLERHPDLPIANPENWSKL